ncbi:hypothetical protein ALC57_18713 [Trachymyrmex cornetzi]|uniref:Uncharacterized protein n=1 Tax=Trachymyrmex cornetzi TaxID=471704 RepID=A0A151IR91_9HYME|nr:hypothetical protein ALC57_18713 [Trachymyrmex cornetzi]
MYLALCHPSDILDLSAEQLQYIPKIVLLRMYGDYIDYVWNKLPGHVKADSEIRTYRRCAEHYNQPWQRTHIHASGGSLLNRAINALPFELHIPGYQFCGPGTRLTKRLAMYLAPYKYGRGQGVAVKKKKTPKETIKMPSGATTNVQLDMLARRMRVSYFRGVFMRNALPTTGLRRNEIVNLDDATGPGTHWVAYAKRNNRVVYFDSFGNLRSPKELVRYFGNGATTIENNRTSYQTYDQSFCGQMCLWFLRTVDAREFKKLDEVP